MESPLLIVLILAVVQGIAEFLPISSSGHIVILSELLSPVDRDKLDITDLNIALHFGTLGSILVVYRKRIIELLIEDRRMIGVLVVASIPAAVVGFLIEFYSYDDVLENALVAGVCLIATGVILLVAARWTNVDRQANPVSYTQATLIGLSQAFAILPGISRSGTTISTGVMLGQPRRAAATFSFLMAIPVIGGAALLKMVLLMRDASRGEAEGATPIMLLAIGALVSFGVGYVALRYLIRLLDRGRFHWFAWWCIPVGIAVVVWQARVLF